MLSPKRIKFRKQHKGRIHGLAKGGSELNFGSFGLKALTPERVTARQIEAARRAITREMKRLGQLWIRIFPDVPVSDKPAEVRMGKGKGSPEFWVARVKPGRIMFEAAGIDEETARNAFALGAAKLPVKTKFVKRLKHKMVKTKDLRAMTIDELEAKLLENKKEQFNLRVQQSTGQLQNTAVIRKVRREIAKINTLLAERKKNS